MNSNQNLNIYVITHKDINIKLPIQYKKMLVGAYKKPEIITGYIRDDFSESNISSKNDNFCELTGLYWIWHHDLNDIKGLVHYRRFFTTNRYKKSIKYFYTEYNICKYLNQYDIIVPERLYIDMPTVKDDYLENHKEQDWIKLKKIIKLYYPNYINAFETIEKNNWFFPYNMFIATTKVFNAYCEWLFDVLFKLEEIVDLSEYDNQQARIFGFISERLLAVWILTNNIKYYEAKVVQIDSRFRYRIRRGLERLLHRNVKWRKIKYGIG